MEEETVEQPKPISPSEFAAKIKSKYPQYQNIDDIELAQKMVAKYPQYKDQVSFDQPEERSFLGAIPVIGDVIHYGGKAVENTLTNQIPQALAGYIQNEQGQLKQNLNDPNSLVNKINKSTLSNENYNQLNQSANSNDLSLKAESYIQQQKNETSQKMKGSVQNLSDVNNVSSFMNWLGSSLGQSAGQIPLSVATGGAGSFIMEAAEVYDTQLDLLAEKHGISREDVIKKGLDKPAEGQVYAKLAGLLDVASAGSILGLFKKIGIEGAKGLAKKEVKNQLLKTAAKDGLFEFFTEGTQGQLEQAGAAKGAGTEYQFSPKQFLNEGAAGLVGGFGVGLASENLSAKLHPSNEAIKAHEDLANNISTGNPELDSNIDDLAIYSAKELSKIFDDVRAVSGEIEGTKLREEQDRIVKSGVDTYKKLSEEEDRVKRQGFISDMLAQFEESPTLTPNHPASEENELGPQVNEIDYNKLNPPQPIAAQPVETQLTQPIINDTQNQEGLQSGVRERKKSIVKQPIERRSSEPITPSGVVQASPAIEEGRQENDKLKEKENKLYVSLDNALKRVPSRRVSALEAISEKADKLGLTELRDKAAKLADKEIQNQQLKVEDKELRKNQILKRKTLEERKAIREEEKQVKRERNAAKKVNQPVKGTSVQKGTQEAREATIKETKEAFLKEIAYQRHTGNSNYTKVAKKYIKFREEQGLPLEDKRKNPITVESVIKQAERESYVEYAKKQAQKEQHERGSIIRKLSLMKKEGKPAEEIQKAHDQLHNEIKGHLAKVLGVKQSDLDQLSGHKLSDVFKNDLQLVTGDVFNKEKLTRLSTEELLKRLQTHQSFRNPFSQAMLKSIERVAKKTGKELRLYEYEHRNPGGFHITGKGIDVLLFTSKALEATERSESTALHEIIHGHMANFASYAFNSDETFTRSVNRVYDYGKVTLQNNLFTSLNKLVKKAQSSPKDSLNQSFKEFAKENLTQEEFNILNATWDYINEFYDNKNQSNYLSNILIQFLNKINTIDTYRENPIPAYEINYITKEIIGSVYGFTNQRELLAEAMSSTAFANLLNQLPYEGKVIKYNSKGKKTNTLLQKLFDALKTFVQKHIFSGPSVFEELETIINNFDELYDEENVNGEIDPFYKITTINDLRMQGEMKGKSIQELVNLQRLLAEVNSEGDAYEADLKKPGLAKKAPLLNKKIISKISRTLEKRNEIKSLKDTQDYVNRVNKNLPTDKQLGTAYTNEIFKAIERLRKKRNALTIAYSDALITSIKNPLYKTSREYQMTTDDFSKVDLTKLNSEQLANVTRGIQALSRNQMVQPSAYNVMITYGKTLYKKRELMSVQDKIDKNISSITSDVSNPSSFSSILSRYNKSVSTKILKHIYSGLMQTFANISTESKELFKNLNAIADKENLTHSNLAKVGLYGSIFSTRSDPNNIVEWSKEVLENAQFAVEATSEKIKALEERKYKGELNKTQILQEHEIAKQLYSKLEKNTKMEDILSSGEQKLYNKFREFAIDHETGFARNSIATWGNEGYQARFNYFPTLAQGKTKGTTKSDFEEDELLGSGKNLMDALGQNTTDQNTLYGKKVWSNYRRLNPKGYFYEVDALAISEKWSKKMLFDVYASTELKALNRLLKDQEFVDAMGQQTVNAFRKQLKSIAGIGPTFKDDMGLIAKTLSKTRDNLYTAVLATSGQVLSQSSSGFAAAAIIAANGGLKAPQIFGKAIAATFKSMKYPFITSKLQTFLEENGMGIQLRDILFEKYLSPSDYQSYTKKKFKGVTNEIQNAAEWGLRAGDKLGARIVWFAAYFNAGGTIEKPTKEAVLEAERWVGMMQNMSDINFTAPAFKYDTVSKKILMGMLYAYKSFAVNSYTNLLYSSRNSLHSKDARTVAIGQLASIVAYHAMAICAVQPLYKAVVNAFTGDDDDDDKKKYSKIDELIAQSAWDIGSIPLPVIGDSFARWIFNKSVAPRIYGDPYEAFDQYTMSPIYSHKSQDDIWKDIAGPGGREMIQAMMDGSILMVHATQAHDYFEDIDKAEKESFEAQLAAESLSNIIMTSMLPIGDVKKIWDAALRKKRAQYLKDKKEGRGSNNVMEGEAPEQVEPEFEEKNYELNQEINQ